MSALARKEWLRQRRTGVGGSDIAGVLGLSPWVTPLGVYLDKTAVNDPEEEAPSEPMRWGTLLEDVIAREYAERGAVRVQRLNTMLRRPEAPHRLANVDRFVAAPGARVRAAPSGAVLGALGLVECKAVSEFAAAEWGDDDAPDIPVHYAAQGMWYLSITGLPWCDLVALVGGQRLAVRRLAADPEVIASMQAEADRFWFEHVVPRVPPPPRTGADVLRLFPRDSARRFLIATPEQMRSISELRSLREESKAIGQRMQALTDALQCAIGDGSGLKDPTTGLPAVTWKAAADGFETDWEKLARSLGATDAQVAQFTTPTAGSRRFLIK